MRYRYRKVDEEKKKKMKEMKESGMSYEKIALHFNVNPSTVQYHLNEKYRKKTIEIAKKSNKNKSSVSRKEYIREYMSNRYRNDKEFAKRVNKTSWECEKKRKAKGKSNL